MMKRIRILSHTGTALPAPLPAAMPSLSTPSSRGMFTDTDPLLPAALAPTSRSTIAAVTSPEVALAFQCMFLNPLDNLLQLSV